MNKYEDQNQDRSPGLNLACSSDTSDDLKIPRSGCRDIWNSFMCEGASFTSNDIPMCPTTATTVPSAIIQWDEAKHIYKKALARGDKDFYYDAFVCFYMDDYKFDGERGIWHNSDYALRVLRHFVGVITPDFSTYQDFPEPLKVYNTYRMRAFGYWLGANGVGVINNTRWGTPETWRYCWDGIPHHSVIAIGTVGGSPRKLADRQRFENGLDELVRVLQPETIIVYGSASYPCFERLGDQGIRVFAYPSRTATAFERRRS